MNNTYLRPPYPNELYHHGILGQKWGIRRFQNEDGSYTAAGKKRYDVGEGEDDSTSDRKGESVEKVANNAKDAGMKLAKSTANVGKYKILQSAKSIGLISPLMPMRMDRVSIPHKLIKKVRSNYFKKPFSIFGRGIL